MGRFCTVATPDADQRAGVLETGVFASPEWSSRWGKTNQTIKQQTKFYDD
jgi:hypothetical protein